MVLEPPPKPELRNLYHIKGKTQSEIAEKFGVGQSTVSRWLEQYNLREKPYRDPETLRELYLEKGMTTYEIGSQFGVSDVTIGNQMKRHGIKRRSNSESHMETHPSIYVSTNGYLTARSILRGEAKSAHIHDLVAIANGVNPYDVFGRDRDGGSVEVHHDNGFKLDNRPSNLTPMTASEHMSLHNAELDRTGSRKLTMTQARDIRRRYDKENITQTKLADEYGVSQRVISDIILEKSYKPKTNEPRPA